MRSSKDIIIKLPNVAECQGVYDGCCVLAADAIGEENSTGVHRC